MTSNEQPTPQVHPDAPPIDESRCLSQSQRTAFRVYQGKAMVIVIDELNQLRLNEVGTFVWQLADGRSLANVIDAVAAEFEVDRETAAKDTQAFVGHLVSLGALEVREPA